jgi:M6 family metalloprotease-like protein
MAGVASAAPVAPVTFTVKQPDGTTLEVRRWGDEWQHGVETLDGYTIVRDRDGVWRYAEAQDGSLVATARRADATAPSGIARRERGAPSVRAPRRASRASVGERLGQEPVLVLLAQFQDRAGTIGAADWHERYFGGAGSVRDYYDETSRGQFGFEPANETDTSGGGAVNDGVIGWLSLPMDHPDTGAINNKNRAVVKAAVEAADPFVNYKSYDKNKDGAISLDELHITVVVAGYEASYGWKRPYVWAHEWSLKADPKLDWGTARADGVKIGAWKYGGGYTQFGEMHRAAGEQHQATTGLIAHEMGHDLDLPDLYDIGDSDAWGVGDWSIMSSGSWGTKNNSEYPGQTPPHFDAWSKLFLGWIEPERTTGPVSLEQVETNGQVLQVRDNPRGVDWFWGGGKGEYFLVENRELVGYDKSLPGCGTLIWRVEERFYANMRPGRRLLTLMEADGANGLDGASSGDFGDPFPGVTGNTVFNDASNPSSKLSDGTPTGVVIKDLAPTDWPPCAATMTMTVKDPQNPRAKSVTKLGVPGPKRLREGSTVTLQTKVKPRSKKSGQVGGTVEFVIDGRIIAKAKVGASGEAKLTTKLRAKAGSATKIQAIFKADPRYNYSGSESKIITIRLI